MRVTNREARYSVMAREPFEGSNLRGKIVNGGWYKQYVVYSYTTPIYVYEDGEEFVNKERYSRTTSRHMSQIGVRNRGILLDDGEIKELVRLGSKLFKKRSVEKALS